MLQVWFVVILPTSGRQPGDVYRRRCSQETRTRYTSNRHLHTDCSTTKEGQFYCTFLRRKHSLSFFVHVDQCDVWNIQKAVNLLCHVTNRLKKYNSWISVTLHLIQTLPKTFKIKQIYTYKIFKINCIINIFILSKNPVYSGFDKEIF